MKTHAPKLSVRVWRVRAVIPCHNRRGDLSLLLGDLAALETGDRVQLSVLVVDNASDEPISGLPAPSGLDIEQVRLAENTGGAGGFNAGIARIVSRGVSGDACELIWLIDSDARLRPDTLLHLVRALEAHPQYVAVGSALAEPGSGRVYEAGGLVSRRHGDLLWPTPPHADQQRDPPAVVDVDYVAACSMLVRRTAIEAAGLMPDVFINSDDVSWCIRLARGGRTPAGRHSSGKVGAVPSSVVVHPHPRRMRTWDRYYIARNAFVPIADLSLGPIVRFRRALRELGRAIRQVMLGRDDLARLHLLGLRDAAAGRYRGARLREDLLFEAPRPLTELAAAIRTEAPRARSASIHADLGISTDDAHTASRALAAAGLEVRDAPNTAARVRTTARTLAERLLRGAPVDVAVVNARAEPQAWFAGRFVVGVEPKGFVIRRLRRSARLLRAICFAVRGGLVALMLMVRRPGRVPGSAPACVVTESDDAPPDRTPAPRPTLSVVVLSYNRADALTRTLSELAGGETAAGAQIIVVDNASSDGSDRVVEEKFPGAELIRLRENIGVGGFNRGVERATGEVVLILDDDSWPDDAGLGAALDLLGRRPDIAAVTLHRKHPRTDEREWPGARAEADGPRSRWPDMGCGNLVRRSAWMRVGGYAESYFLYRNDTDLALKLIGGGCDVHFDPRWLVWHDSPVVRRKSDRWLRLATRNWVWTAKRHGRGLWGMYGLLLGWAWAHKLAGRRPRGHLHVLRGALAGLVRKAPPLPATVRADGRAFRRLIELKLRYR